MISITITFLVLLLLLQALLTLLVKVKAPLEFSNFSASESFSELRCSQFFPDT